MHIDLVCVFVRMRACVREEYRVFVLLIDSWFHACFCASMNVGFMWARECCVHACTCDIQSFPANPLKSPC